MAVGEIMNWTPPRKAGGMPRVSTRFSRLTRDGTAEPVSRDQILRRERGQEKIYFPCPVDHEQNWQPYPIDPYIHTYIRTVHRYIINLLYDAVQYIVPFLTSRRRYGPVISARREWKNVLSITCFFTAINVQRPRLSSL